MVGRRAGGADDHLSIYHAAANIREPEKGLPQGARRRGAWCSTQRHPQVACRLRINWRLQERRRRSLAAKEMSDRWIRDDDFTEEDEEKILREQG